MNPKAIADAAIKVGVKAVPVVKKAGPVIKKAGPLVKKAAKAAGPGFKKAKPILDEFAPLLDKPLNIAASKMRKVMLKADSSGERIFKYDLSKLTELVQKQKISIDMYNYLTKEILEHEYILRKGSKVFEGYFDKLSKVKDMTQSAALIAEYELARDKWIEAINKKKESAKDNKIND